MNMEQNKIFAALLVAGIIAMASGFIADGFVHPQDLEKPAYEIDTSSIASASSAGGDAAPAGPEPVAELLASADIERGRKLSKACATCHTFDQGGANKTGPNLWKVAGRSVASGDFPYSSAMAEHGGKWTTDELNHFLWKPKKYISGTKMNYAGLKKTSDRAALIAWLQTLK